MDRQKGEGRLGRGDSMNKGPMETGAGSGQEIGRRLVGQARGLA